ncbi:MAG: hydrogenase maturation nickel metallochaperone HypA [Candidatus Thorarchaeota archaeon]|jgi:hydrogenase nickel incorporation protein HypA/HybF
MHEFSAACSIVEAAVQAAETHDVKRVTAVNVEVGEFTFLIPEQLEFNFEIASKKTILEGAMLKIKKVRGRIKCQQCAHEGVAQLQDEVPSQVAMFAPMKCPKCQSSATVITGGKDFVITNIEAEVVAP